MFFTKFLKIFSGDGVHFLCSGEADHQAVGEAHDLGAAGAEASVHAIVVGAGCFGDGDGAVLDGDGIASAVVGGEGELLIVGQWDGAHQLAVYQDFCMGSIFGGQEQGDAEAQAGDEKDGKQDDPGFGFHREFDLVCAGMDLDSFLWDSIAKIRKKRKKKCEKLLDNF